MSIAQRVSLIGLTVLGLGTLSAVQAATPQIEKQITLEQPIKSVEPTILVGQEIEIEKNVSGDLYLLGNNVHVSSKVTGDLTVLAQTLIFDGELDGDLRAISINSEIGGKISGISSVANLQTKISGQIKELFLASLGAQLDGDFTSVWAFANQINFFGSTDELHSRAQIITLGESALINKNFNHVGQNAPLLLPGAKVENLNYQETTYRAFGWFDGYAGYVLLFLSIFAFIFGWNAALFYFGQSLFKKLLVQGQKKILNSFWIGIGALLVGLFLGLVALLARVVWWLAILDAVFLFIGFLSGIAIFVGALGAKLQFWFWKKPKLGWLAILVGSFVTTVLLMLPLVGPLLSIVFILLGIGNLTILVWQARLDKQNHD